MYCWQVVHNFVQTLVWPAIVLIAIILFRDQIRFVIEKITSLEFKAGNFGLILGSAQYNSRDSVYGVRTTRSDGYGWLQKNVAQTQALLVQSQEASQRKDHSAAVLALKEANRLMPNQWVVLHNLGVELIRYAKTMEPKHPMRSTSLVEAEVACRAALLCAEQFPYGTFYNLARAQGLGFNLIGIRETFDQMSKTGLPPNLAEALVKWSPVDPDVISCPEIAELEEFKRLSNLLRRGLSAQG